MLQIIKRLHQAIKKSSFEADYNSLQRYSFAFGKSQISCSWLSLLHDVIATLENTISEENVNYIQEYFPYPFFAYRKKICISLMVVLILD